MMQSGQEVATFHGAANVRNMGDGPKSSMGSLFDSVPVSFKIIMASVPDFKIKVDSFCFYYLVFVNSKKQI